MNRTSTILFWSVVLLGIAIRVNQYFRRPALWLDEAMLSLSIVKRSWRALIFSPLEFSQTAPPLYLQIAKISTLIFGPNALALRLPSMVFSVASMILFGILARRIFRSGAAILACAFFALSPTLALYSAEAKPYAADILVSVALVLLAIKLRDSRYETGWVIASMLAIGASVFLADIGVLVVAGVGIGLIFLAWRERDVAAWKLAKVLAPVWLFLGLFAVWGIKRRIAGNTSSMLHSAWGRSFWPLLPPHQLSDVLWPATIIPVMYKSLVGVKPFYGITLLVAIIGVIVLCRQGKGDIAALVFGPFLIALGASAAKVYPFTSSRVSLYLVPALIIALAAGLDFFARLRPSLAPVLRAGLFVVFLLPQSFVLTWSTPPWLVEDVPGVLAHIKENRKPGDKIYAYWAALPATFYYGPKFGIKPEEIVMGQMHDKDLAGYTHDLDSLRGNPRVWLIFSHDDHPDQRNAILARMDSVGRLMEAFPAQTDRPDASVFLYDLSGRTGP